MFQVSNTKRKLFMPNLSLNMLRKKPLKSLTILFILACALMMQGCGSRTISSNLVIPTIPELPANLSTPCQKPSKLEDGKAGTLLMWNVANIPKMHECDWKHEGVVEAYSGVRQVMLDFAKEVEAMKKK